MMLTNTLLTGRPGVGKTTLVRQILKRLPAVTISGFFTAEIRLGGQRQGFRVVTLDGRETVLAHVDFCSEHRVGRYRVDVTAFEVLVLPSLVVDSPAALIVIDEIGKMECLSRAFREAVVRVLDANTPVLATVAWRGDRFIQDLKARRDVAVVEVTLANRDRLVHELSTSLKKGLRGG